MNKKNVVIVGAGPTGLLCALGLAKTGIEVCVVERADAIQHSPRAMVYHWAVLDGLEKLGVLEDAKAEGFLSPELQFYVFKTGERIHLDTREALKTLSKTPYNLHLGQNKLAEIALSHLQKLPNFSIRWGVDVTGLTQSEHEVTLHCQQGDSQEDISAAWVIGADGANSIIRRSLNLSFDGITWPERFVATNVRGDFAKLGFSNATMMLDPEVGAIVARIDNDNLWRVTYCESLELPEDQVPERIPGYFAKILPEGTEYEVIQYSPYRMHQRAAESMRVGRVLLAGDAAHITNPTGGLGLTSGLFDIFVLHEALTAVIEGRVDPEILDRYSESRLKAFLEHASPAASEFKKLVYHCSDKEELEHKLAGLRHLQAHPELQVAMFGTAKSVETPSLISG
ncbi:FAD-dependent monooxygenase [Pseudomonas sp. UL073]|uniref:FAD-dependent monooxygenase n=1 Tax=Zestomonas insulae TaxID=2809017 RepID=A0ABS2IDA4_9GAMM|nr:NAD(P)/FAD-dependent oxidoreductase [Pseudomonas insulae]MBM7061015.1 FAD-dependent monooxygenase [Pseudomonas insulae]